jgi:hypothetical protein
MPLGVVLVLLFASTAAAQPSHCERPLEPGSWPAIGEDEGAAPAAAVQTREARAVVGVFRRAFARMPGRSTVLRAFGQCMNGSFEHFTVRRIAVSIARARIDALVAEGAPILSGDASALSGDWVYEVYWGGASRRFRPSGPVSGFVSSDGRTVLAALQWPEG